MMLNIFSRKGWFSERTKDIYSHYELSSRKQFSKTALEHLYTETRECVKLDLEPVADLEGFLGFHGNPP